METKKIQPSTGSNILYCWWSHNWHLPFLVLTLTLKGTWLNYSLAGKLYYLKGLLPILGSSLVLAGLPSLFKGRARLAVILLLDAVISLLLWADLVFHRYFNDVLSAAVIPQMGVVGEISQSIAILIRPSDLWLGADLVILAALMIKKVRLTANPPPTPAQRAAGFLLPLTLGLALIGIRVQRLEKGLLTSTFDHTLMVERLGAVNYHAWDLWQYFGREKTSPSPQETAQTLGWLEDRCPERSPLFGRYAGHNLIVVQVEALQGFVLGREFLGQEITPNLNQLAARSRYWPDIVPQTAQGNTSDAEFLTNVSLYPLAAGSVNFRYPANCYPSLANLLGDQGYSTAAFHAFRPSYWNRGAMYRSLGFDTFVNSQDFTLDETIGWGLGDKSFFTQSVERLKSLPPPFHAFLVTLSSHHPYDSFAQISNLDLGSLEGTMTGNYLRAIHYTDQALGQLVEDLEESGLLDQSILAVYGDHAALQKENIDELEILLERELDSDLAWGQLQRVPFLIHFPGDRHAGEEERVGGQIDIMPTLADLLGLESKYALGRNLLCGSQDVVVLRSGSFTDGRVFYLSFRQKVYDCLSGEILPAEQFQQYFIQSREQLKHSDRIIQHDLAAPEAGT